jgi:hypothetical protein
MTNKKSAIKICLMISPHEFEEKGHLFGFLKFFIKTFLNAICGVAVWK